MNSHIDLTTSIVYTVIDDIYKVVVRVKEPSMYAVLHMRGQDFPEAYNYKEPLDLLTHVFFVPEKDFSLGEHVISFSRYHTSKNEWFDEGTLKGCSICFLNETNYKNYSEGVSDQDNQIIIPEFPSEREILEGNVVYSRYDSVNKYSEPIVFFTLEVDSAYATFVTGTPNDEYVSGGVKQTVRDEALFAMKNGRNVVAATNADFFDIFGNLKPAGLCIKNGVVVDNGDSDRPFLCLTKEGKFAITTLEEYPQAIQECEQAVSGGQIVMKNSNIAEICVMEPFGYIKHPRTAAGTTSNGKLILLIVDGRIKEYSNGASLLDIANLLKGLGAETAINLDGGGSSTMLVRNKDSFEVRNIPADLERPYDRLIRDLYDSILVVVK